MSVNFSILIIWFTFALIICDDKLDILISKFIQNDYFITLERAELSYYNPRYVSYAKVVSFKYNRTIFAINGTCTLKKDIGYEGQIVAQQYQFLSNEYRYFPMRMQVPFCRAIKNGLLGFGNFACGNFTGCPAVKGKTQHICNWYPDAAKCPPGIPSGRYMLEFNLTHHSEVVFTARGYFEITHPIRY